MTDLQTELAALIAESIEEWHRQNRGTPTSPAQEYVAGRVASAFTPVQRRRLGASYDSMKETLYRFVRPESVEP